MLAMPRHRRETPAAHVAILFQVGRRDAPHETAIAQPEALGVVVLWRPRHRLRFHDLNGHLSTSDQ